MRPIFIYKYEERKRKLQKEDEFEQMYFQDANKMEEIYAYEDEDNTARKTLMTFIG